MGCCKAGTYKWCKGLDTVYTDEEEKEYCVFHAPKGKKGVANIEEFNDLIFTRILEARNSKGICNLSGTIFSKPINFKQFCDNYDLPAINLSLATFNDSVSFKNVNFIGDAIFSGTVFEDNAYFEGTIFNGIIDFRNSYFDKKADFKLARFIGNAYFEATYFNGTADFSSKRTSWEIRFIRKKYPRTLLYEKRYLHKTFTKKAVFKLTTFTKETNFLECSSNDIIRFEEVDLARVSFIGSNLFEFDFLRCTWQKKFGRNILYDEINAPNINKNKHFEKVEDLYRQLKRKYKDEHNEPEVSNWHYGEKEMFRKKILRRRLNPISFSNLYWAFSGYGECPVRAGIILLLLIIFIMIGMNYFGLVPFAEGNPVYEVAKIKGFSGSIDWKKLWLLFYNTIQHILFFKAPFLTPETLIGDIFLTVSTRIMIPIQAALFAFALRNKFRR